ncbi:MarR family transcriptional regulator [Marinobacterium zhoushanense]|uniref:MarR family transcriptional regulator n=2 Tax=Marinobacterium zhoushanense TaxID=1679163 RepID=A0ABQ1K1I2_9GAMM|nr:MarR family transcriptional regulator [Marinobacterium zhoushanense]
MKDFDPLALDNQLCFTLYSTSLAMTQMYKPLLDPLGLTYPQYLVMMILWQEDGIGLKDIGAKLGQQSGALTPVIKRLEQEGRVRRVRDPQDERALCIQLTPEGKALRQQALGIGQCVLDACGFNLEELVDLKRKIDQLRRNIQNSTQ